MAGERSLIGLKALLQVRGGVWEGAGHVRRESGDVAVPAAGPCAAAEPGATAAEPERAAVPHAAAGLPAGQGGLPVCPATAQNCMQEGGDNRHACGKGPAFW